MVLKEDLKEIAYKFADISTRLITSQKKYTAVEVLEILYKSFAKAMKTESDINATRLSIEATAENIEAIKEQKSQAYKRIERLERELRKLTDIIIDCFICEERKVITGTEKIRQDELQEKDERIQGEKKYCCPECKAKLESMDWLLESESK